MKTYLDEQKVDTLQRAATLADDYTLTHRKVFLGSDNIQKGTNRSGRNENSLPPARYNLRSHDNSELSRRQSGPTCYYCKKKGHVMSECWALEKREKNKSKTDIVAVKTQNSSSDGLSCVESNEEYRPFIYDELVSLVGEESNAKPIRVLRDTGVSQSILLEGVLPLSESTYTGSNVLLQGVELGVLSVPLHIVHLSTQLVCGPVMIGVRPSLPVPGISLLLGNHLAGDKVMVNPCVSPNPQVSTVQEDIEQHVPGLFPSCAVTRAMARKENEQRSILGISDKEMPHENVTVESNSPNPNGKVLREDILPPQLEGSPPLTRKQLIKDQQSDPELGALIQDALTEEEAQDQPVYYFQKVGILMRKWRSPTVPSNEEWQVSYQIVVPLNCRADILQLAHATPMAGHLARLTNAY